MEWLSLSARVGDCDEERKKVCKHEEESNLKLATPHRSITSFNLTSPLKAPRMK